MEIIANIKQGTVKLVKDGKTVAQTKCNDLEKAKKQLLNDSNNST